jgi:hypothetical protein
MRPGSSSFPDKHLPLDSASLLATQPHDVFGGDLVTLMKIMATAIIGMCTVIVLVVVIR